MKTIKKIAPPIFLVLLFATLFFSAEAQRVTNVNSIDDLKNNVLCKIVNVMFWTFIVVAIIMVLWSAFLYLTSGGDSEKVKTASKSLTYAAVAIVVGILANSFPTIVGSIFRLSGGAIVGCPTG